MILMSKEGRGETFSQGFKNKRSSSILLDTIHVCHGNLD